MIYKYNKLVRDKIPENINKQDGKKCTYRILNDNEYLQELNKKVIEEANEFAENDDIEELGDLLEVIDTIIKLKKYNNTDINEIMKNKKDRRGGFERKIFLETVEEEKRNIREEQELKKKFRNE